MSAGGTLGVRVAALKATVALVSALEEPSQRKEFQSLIPAMLQTLGAALSEDEDKAQDALSLFVALAEEDARFIRKYINEVALAMLHIAELSTLEDGTRQLALEFLVTLAEARESAPGMIRKIDGLTGRLITCALGFLLDIEEDPAWNAAENEEDMDAGQGDRFDAGMECLDRLSVALGAKAVLPVLGALLPGLLAHADWRQRHAALCCLAQAAEGCAKAMRKDPAGAVAPALRALGDPHPRVRWAAINALGQLCTDLAPELQSRTHASVLPGLIAVMEDTGNPRVQAHAAAAVVNFAEECEPEVLAPYMDGLIVKLLTLLQSGTRRVQEAVLTSLASVADTAQAQFERYYDTVMPFLITILSNANDEPVRLLRAKALECATLVGMAVGRERFRGHARAVLDIMVRLQNTPPAEADDPTPGYLLQGWARMCTCMGDEFLPYLDIVMPALLAAAEQKPDVRVRDMDDVENGDEEDEEDVQLIAVGEQVLAIRTSVLEDKATACNMLCCYVDELGAGLLPHLERITAIMVPLLKFYFSEDVRHAAVSIVPSLIKAGTKVVEQNKRDAAWLRSLVTAVWTPLLEALHREPDPELACAMLLSLAEAAEAGAALLSPDQMAALSAELCHQLQESSERSAARAARAAGEEFDDEEREMLADENGAEDELIDAVQECISSLLKAFHAAYLPYLQALVPAVMALAASPSSVLRRIAVCIFDDVIEYASETGATASHFDAFFPFLLAGAADAHDDLRQAAVYGLGVCAQHCTPRFRSRAPEAAAALLAVMRAPDARGSERVYATDNAVSALAKAVEFAGDALADAPALLGAVLDFLPMRGDTEEAKLVHAQLCRFLEAGDARLLGPANERLPRVVAVFADCFASGEGELITPATGAARRGLLARRQASMPPAQLQAAWGQLTPQQQGALQAALAAAGAPHGS